MVAIGGGATTVAGITDIGQLDGQPQADGGQASVTLDEQTNNGTTVP